jgi:hypothetical protein
MYGLSQPLIRNKLTAIDESFGYPAFGKATPIGRPERLLVIRLELRSEVRTDHLATHLYT